MNKFLKSNSALSLGNSSSLPRVSGREKAVANPECHPWASAALLALGFFGFFFFFFVFLSLASSVLFQKSWLVCAFRKEQTSRLGQNL